VDGQMVLESAAGTWFGRHRFITAVTTGRVEKITASRHHAGRAGTIILELSNPDVEIQTSRRQAAH
jgi:hypothetical protein